MHDPLTVAFEIKSPFHQKPTPMCPGGYQEPIITIWHVDPEFDGSDDSCGWFSPRLTSREIALAKSIATNSERELEIYWLFRELKRLHRPWWKHPRWHFWHWRIQIHCIQNLKRWLFTRCCKCGKRFPYGTSPMTDCWNGYGPRWFRSEEFCYHQNCKYPEDYGPKVENK